MFKWLQVSRRFHSVFALSTGGLPAALAIIRITGNESGQALSRLTGQTVNKFEPQRLFYTPLYNERRQIIDRGMAVFLKGPGTFTGEDTVELYVHGSRAVVDMLLSTLSQLDGLRPAKAGEFTRRAFFNSKLNVAQLEALGDLLNAETSSQLRLAHKQQEAAKKLEPIRSRLIQLIARLEAAIDFAEDMESQQNRSWKDEFWTQVKEVEEQLRKLVKLTRKGMIIRSGVSVVFIGRTNVGKSSLMNQLASRDVAIVSKIPGTTRDSLEVRVSLANLPITITDTAGLRETNDELESEGILRSIKRSSEAHMVVLIVSADELLKNECTLENELNYLERIAQLPNHVEKIVCINKSDLLNSQQREQLKKNSVNLVFSSALEEANVQPLVDALTQRISTISANEEGQELFLSRERHVHLLSEAIESLNNAFQGSFDSAIAAHNLRDAIEYIGEISGSVVNERILDEIFSQFCIGK